MSVTSSESFFFCFGFSYAESSGNDSIASDADDPKTEEPEREDQDDEKTDDDNASRRSILADIHA